MAPVDKSDPTLDLQTDLIFDGNGEDKIKVSDCGHLHDNLSSPGWHSKSREC